MIPLVIFQFWDNPDSFAYEHHAHLMRTKYQLMMPNYQFILWNDAIALDFITEHYPWFLSIYQNYSPPIKRWDSIRYFYMYYFGGIYIDTDSTILKTFSNIMELSPTNAPIFGYQRRNTKAIDAIGTAFFASPPRHPFFWYVIQQLKHTKNYPVLMATGPIFFTNCVRNFGIKHFKILEMPFFYTHEWHEQKPKSLPSISYITTDWHASWKK